MESNIPEDSKPDMSQVPNEGRPWLAIGLQADGSIKVTGWIDDKLVGYGLLSMAHDAIRGHIDKQAKIERVNASGGLLHNLRNGFHK